MLELQVIKDLEVTTIYYILDVDSHNGNALKKGLIDQ